MALPPHQLWQASTQLSKAKVTIKLQAKHRACKCFLFSTDTQILTFPPSVYGFGSCLLQEAGEVAASTWQAPGTRLSPLRRDTGIKARKAKKLRSRGVVLPNILEGKACGNWNIGCSGGKVTFGDKSMTNTCKIHKGSPPCVAQASTHGVSTLGVAQLR